MSILKSFEYISRCSGGIYTIEVPRKAPPGTDVYNIAEQDGKTDDLTSEAYDIQAAKFSIRYRKRVNAPRTNQLTFNISLPNRCDLKDKKSIEQTLNNRLLKRWGLLQEIE